MYRKAILYFIFALPFALTAQQKIVNFAKGQEIFQANVNEFDKS